MLSSFNKLLSYNVLGLKGSKAKTNYIQRDELSKNPSTKKGEFLASREPLLCEEEEYDEKKRSYVEDQKGVIRVKVKMTKEEAARLLSKCKDGGILEFGDVAHELVHIPLNRVSIVSSTCSFGGVLNTIHEEN